MKVFSLERFLYTVSLLVVVLPYALHEPRVEGLVVVFKVNPATHARHNLLWDNTIQINMSLIKLLKKLLLENLEIFVVNVYFHSRWQLR